MDTYGLIVAFLGQRAMTITVILIRRSVIARPRQWPWQSRLHVWIVALRTPRNDEWLSSRAKARDPGGKKLKRILESNKSLKLKRQI